MANSALQHHYTPLQQDIICSDTAIAALPATLDALRTSRAMMTCGSTILSSCNVVPRVQEALGLRDVGVYAGVAPHAPIETVEEGVVMAKEVQPDVFISVGGGGITDHHLGRKHSLGASTNGYKLSELAIERGDG
jgi:alcohol dehydrogenase class IV